MALQEVTPVGGQVAAQVADENSAVRSAIDAANRAHRGITVAAADSPAWMKRIADYVCDGTADDVEWQAAIDEAQTYLASGITAVPPVSILPGTYIFTSGITKKTAALIGETLANTGVRVFWNGGNGTGTAITQGVEVGGTAFGEISQINFRNWTGEDGPECWVDLTATHVDAFYQLRHVHFIGGDDQIRVGGWANVHWEHLRFDHWHNAAVSLTPHAALNGGSFVIDKFTADHSSTTNPGKTFLHIDITASPSSVGKVVLSNARIELNQTLRDDKSVVSIETGAVANSRTVQIGLYDLSITAPAAHNLLYRDSANTTASETMHLRNVTFPTDMTIGAGTWPSAFVSPAHSGYVAHLDLQGDLYVMWSTTTHRLRNASDQAIVVTSETKAHPRLMVRGDGYLEWNNGNAASGDVNLYRSAANLLKTDDKFVASSGIGVGNSAAATTPGTVTRKIEVFDASGASLGFIPVYDAIT